MAGLGNPVGFATRLLVFRITKVQAFGANAQPARAVDLSAPTTYPLCFGCYEPHDARNTS
jgi:hypothetical protein